MVTHAGDGPTSNGAFGAAAADAQQAPRTIANARFIAGWNCRTGTTRSRNEGGTPLARRIVAFLVGDDELADGSIRGLLRHLARERVAADLSDEARSEEHTSELQSRSDLVCRLLLEKKKQPTIYTLLCQTKKNTKTR